MSCEVLLPVVWVGLSIPGSGLDKLSVSASRRGVDPGG